MSVFLVYLILNIFSKICGITYIQNTICPHPSHRILRANAFCKNNSITRYQCLYNINHESYVESCSAGVDYVGPGQKYQQSGNFLLNKECNKERYQPFKLWSNVSSQCVLQRSKCNEIGQVIYNNGTMLDDRLCSCDYTKGFSFVYKPQHSCFCIPSIEDCTCYKKQCSGWLTSDYMCTKPFSIEHSCPLIWDIDTRQDKEINHKTDSSKETSKIEGFRFANPLYSAMVITVVWALIFSCYILWLYVCRIKKVVNSEIHVRTKRDVPIIRLLAGSCDPGRPRHLSALTTDDGIALSWTAPDYPLVTGIKNYKVSCTCNGNQTIYLVSPVTTSFLISDVLPSTEYKLKVILCTVNNINMVSNTVIHITTAFDFCRKMYQEALSRDEQKRRLQIKDIKEKPKAMKISVTDHSVSNPRIVIQRNLKSPPKDTFYSRKTSTTYDEFIFTYIKKRPRKLTEKQNYLQEVSTFEKTEYIKNEFMDCMIDKRIHRLNTPTVENFKNLKNLLIECNCYLVNCDVDRRLRTKITGSDVPVETGFSGIEMSDFAKLVFTIHHVDKNSISSKFWNRIFWPAIKNKDSSLCRFLLTIITGMTANQWKECNHYLLEGLLSSMTNQDKDTAKVIAWFITKKLFQSFDKSVREHITDIWPASICNCHRQQHVFCSDKIAIYIEMNTSRPDLPETFWKIDVKYITDDRAKTKQGSQIHEHLQNLSGKIHIPNKISISSVDAKQLFNEHSNLSLICKSPFKSIGYKDNKHRVIEQSCFQLYCKSKGIIPIGENHFPITLNGLQTDVVEGSPNFISQQLKVGNQVGTDECKRGTLGGFVQVRGDTAFLTCLHVFLSTDELASENISLDDEKTVLVKLYQDNTNSVVCGKIREIAFEVDNEKETSIDAALVEISADRIDNSNYVDVENGQLSFKDIGMKSEYLNSSCVDYKPLLFSIPKPVLRTVFVGAVSGCFDGDKAQVEANEEKCIDLEQIDKLYSQAVLEEIKRNVIIVINHLQLIPIAVLPDDNIKKSIELKCDCNLSSAIKNIIIDIIKNIYPIINSTSEVDIDNYILCTTNSRFSAIVGDVHMQHAFLKKTGKNMAIKRTSRRVYNQLYISNIPFKPGDSGTCIYVLSPVQGCIGMAIADHPQGGCIATPIMDILKHFKIRIK